MSSFRTKVSIFQPLALPHPLIFMFFLFSFLHDKYTYFPAFYVMHFDHIYLCHTHDILLALPLDHLSIHLSLTFIIIEDNSPVLGMTAVCAWMWPYPLGHSWCKRRHTRVLCALRVDVLSYRRQENTCLGFSTEQCWSWTLFLLLLTGNSLSGRSWATL